MPYKSCAQWPEGTIGTDGDLSEDTHDSREQADGVCHYLRYHGFGGNGKVFPLAAWSEETGYTRLKPEMKAAILKTLREAPGMCQITGCLVKAPDENHKEGSLDGLCYCAEGLILKALGLNPVLLPPALPCKDSVWVMQGVVNGRSYTASGSIPAEVVKDINWPLGSLLYHRMGSGTRELQAVSILNDDFLLSLKEIADLIEEQW